MWKSKKLERLAERVERDLANQYSRMEVRRLKGTADLNRMGPADGNRASAVRARRLRGGDIE